MHRLRTVYATPSGSARRASTRNVARIVGCELMPVQSDSYDDAVQARQLWYRDTLILQTVLHRTPRQCLHWTARMPSVKTFDRDGTNTLAIAQPLGKCVLVTKMNPLRSC